MKNRQKIANPPESSENQFKKPSRPTAARAPSTSKRAAPSSTSERPWKRSSIPTSRAQSTLTQIEFVTQTTQPDDVALDYIDGSNQNEAEHATPIMVEDRASSDSGSDDQPSLPMGSGITRSNFESNNGHPRSRRNGERKNPPGPATGVRKSQSPRASIVSKGKRKSAEKPPTKRDKTLTQMDFVRRYITIDDDDDVNLGYIESSTVKAPNTKKENVLATKGINRPSNPNVAESPSLKRNRREPTLERDLSTGEPLTSDGHSQISGQESVPGVEPDSLATPTRPRKLEIPSSQSPESPGLAIITSSQFRSAARSPAKRITQIFHQDPDTAIKEESPGQLRNDEGLDGQPKSSTTKTPTTTSPKLHITSSQHPSKFVERLASCGRSTDSSPHQPPTLNRDSQISHTQRERMVVYETDAESDQSDLEPDTYGGPSTPSRGQNYLLNNTQTMRPSPTSKFDDSHDLPLPPAQSRTEPDSGPPSEPMSDASVYYQRMQPATQFPYEPIPSLNTQKLSELFPNESCSQSPGPNPRLDSSEKVPGPFLYTQTQSQEADQTEIVPESSPAREQEDDSIENNESVFQRPRLPGSIVQVESSQPAERRDKGNRLLSRSQLLTSSIMESVPLPNFCMSSQDSVGEPYSSPDR